MASTTMFEARDTLASDSTTDPDVSGPGVIVGFLLANTLTVLASYAALYTRRKEDINPNARMFGIRARYWSRLLGEFVLSLSDQQLLTGLIMLVVGMARYYFTSVTLGANNMWTAADTVVFSSVTHGATMLAARPYFRKHPNRSIFRVGVMCTIYMLWLAIAVNILSPVKPMASKKLSRRLTDFWHAATYIEAIGVAWMYFIVITPLFVSKNAAQVRSAIAQLASSDKVAHRLAAWEGYIRFRRISSAEFKPTCDIGSGPFGRLLCILEKFAREYATYDAISSRIAGQAGSFCRLYIAHDSRRRHRVLWFMAEIFWPWWTSVMIIGLLWMFGFTIMIVNIIQNGLGSDWGFGQLLSPALILLPIYELIIAIIGMLLEEDPRISWSNVLTDCW